mgnify:CR=1 FL=1
MRPEYTKSIYIWQSIKNTLNERNITITDMCNKISASRPTVNNVLNWKTIWSDQYFFKIMKSIWLSDKKIEEIFEEADREVFRHKYWKDILSEREYSYDELFSMMKEKENLSDKQINAIQDYIELQKLKWNN